MRWIGLLLALFPVFAGEHKRFDLPVAPGGRTTTIHVYVFDAREEAIRIVQPSGEAADLRSVCARESARAGINGGFFDSTGNPLGIVISSGRLHGQPSHGSSLTCGLLRVAGDKPSLARCEGHDFANETASELLQAGPLLMENGRIVTELQPSRYARRSLILTDGGHLWAIAYVPSATLDGLAKALAAPGGFPPFQPAAVLNLGGATSSGFWIRRQSGLDFYLREVVKVPNFIVIVPRPRIDPK